MEQVWDELEWKPSNLQGTTHLWKLLQQNWEELSEEYLIYFVEKTPHVAVVFAKPGFGLLIDFNLNSFLLSAWNTLVKLNCIIFNKKLKKLGSSKPLVYIGSLKGQKKQVAFSLIGK
ncbi:hypothetical protein CHARACLAT_032019 [Characodon lateralis]|uniref:Uncharacterized protein n=1 Tax=Characodon lateralis TaxID=208331 RepID=A0ABU7EHU4_9TELE|nr:hypothetical protein [Characodon lateralis]